MFGRERELSLMPFEKVRLKIEFDAQIFVIGRGKVILHKPCFQLQTGIEFVAHSEIQSILIE